MSSPGRTCPLRYRYRPEALARPPALRADTAYVIGGLYGNPEALRAVLAMRERESALGRDVALIFNGDFNWFDVAPEDFDFVNRTVLAHTAIAGNVEAELAAGDQDAGCGCAYPAFVDDATVARSNAIMRRLGTTAASAPALTARLGTLPYHLTVAVGDTPVGVLHGDPESLAGWQFCIEALEAADGTDTSGATATPAPRIETFFRDAQVRVFACTHTCLPFAQVFDADGEPALVVNNGSAGMPNFEDTRFGLITRLSGDPAVPEDSLYGVDLGGLRCDALPVRFDHERWVERFLGQWPPGSPAHESYFERILNGPRFEPARAMRAGVTPP